jgi:hypothetical protein
MAEQSSAVVLLRACVMLLCLIMIPIAALFGTAIPNVVKALQSGRLPTLAELRGPAAPVNPTPFSPFQSTPLPGGSLQAGPTGNPALPISRQGGTDTAGTAPSGAGDNVAPLWTGPTGYPAGNGADNAVTRQPGPTAMANSVVVPVNYTAPMDNHVAAMVAPIRNGAETARLAPPDRSAATAPLTIPNGTDPFTYVQNRLQELGATYFLLESWGDRKREYRFYCKMAVGGNADYTKAFFWVDGDPQRAMMHVLQEVEGWHAGG